MMMKRLLLLGGEGECKKAEAECQDCDNVH